MLAYQQPYHEICRANRYAMLYSIRQYFTTINPDECKPSRYLSSFQYGYANFKCWDVCGRQKVLVSANKTHLRCGKFRLVPTAIYYLLLSIFHRNRIGFTHENQWKFEMGSVSDLEKSPPPATTLLLAMTLS